jgi:hypothetical protein
MKKSLLFAAVMCLAGCGSMDQDVSETDLVGSDETMPFDSVSLPERAELIADTAVNMRKAPSADAELVMVVPMGSTLTALQAQAENGYYKVALNDWQGWVYGAHVSVAGKSLDPLTTAEIDAVIARAAGSVGYSYWWGGGAWGCGLASGSCSGSCPSCSHSGSAGADCSGMVGQAWHVPPSSSASTCSNEHPYSSTMFYNNRTYWTGVSRSDMRRADAMVREGHIYLKNSTSAAADGWGTMDVYECSGCANKCWRRSRTADSSYIAIRRNSGWL